MMIIIIFSLKYHLSAEFYKQFRSVDIMWVILTQTRISLRPVLVLKAFSI